MRNLPRITFFFIMLLSGVALCAQAKNGDHTNDIGIMFQIENVNRPLDNYTDGGFFGGQGGLGIRWWPLKELALRGVVYMDFQTITATDDTAFYMGVSVGAEYHFLQGIVSPYAGGLAGIEFVSDATQSAMDYHIGGFLGVELSALEFLSLFVEYSLLVTVREPGIEVDLGYNHLPTFGLIIYFN
ncbi:MAG TPA: hypothetical protein ENN69_07665 [Spirochaetia bacterium]|nr:hypothetical protein [Spirochaetia bacterium]